MARVVNFMKGRLESLIDLQSFSAVARVEGVDESSIRSYVKNALKSRYIKKFRGRFAKGPEWENEQDESGWIEVHNLTFTFPVKNPTQKWSQHAENLFDNMHAWYLEKNPSYKYNESMKQFYHEFSDWDGWIVRTTTKSVMLQMKEGFPMRGQDATELANRIYDFALRRKKDLEMRFLVQLGTEETTFKVSSQHWVLLDTIIAKRFREEDKRLSVWIDGELRSVVDFSGGVPHLEHVDRKHAPMDTREWEKVVADVNTGQYMQRVSEHKELSGDVADLKVLAKTMIQGIQAVNDNVGKVSDSQKVYAENWVSHVDYIQTLGIATAKMSRAVELLTVRVGELGAKGKKHRSLPEGQDVLDRWLR